MSTVREYNPVGGYKAILFNESGFLRVIYKDGGLKDTVVYAQSYLTRSTDYQDGKHFVRVLLGEQHLAEYRWDD